MENYKDLLKSMAEHSSSVIYLKDLEGECILVAKTAASPSNCLQEAIQRSRSGIHAAVNKYVP